MIFDYFIGQPFEEFAKGIIFALALFKAEQKARLNELVHSDKPRW